MTFERPGGLWLFALALPVVAFHFYRGRVKRMPVPTILFWEQVLVEEERRTALRKLRHLASLALNLAALVLLTSAVASPRLRPPARYAVIMDNSASMGAVEADGRTRLASALDRAREFVRSLAWGDQVAVHDLAGPRLPFTSDLDRLAREWEAPPPALPGDLRARVADALLAGEDVTAVLFTDRAPAGMEDFLSPRRLRVARVGTPAANVGWTGGLPVRRPGERKAVLHLSILNASGDAASRTARLLFNGRELERRGLELAPGERALEWALDPARYPGSRIEEGGLVQVVLEPPDALPVDDAASFVLPPLVPPPVVVFHGGSAEPLLMLALQALQADGMVGAVGGAKGERFAAVKARLGEGSIVIFDRVAPPENRGPGGFLVIGAPGGRGVERPVVAGWDAEAPPNRMADYAGLAVRRSRILEGEALIRAVEGPLAVWSSRGGRAEVELGFTLDESDFALRPAFLIFLRNFVEWASFSGLRSFRAQYGVGEPLRPERPMGEESGPVTFSQARLERSEIRSGRPALAPAAEPGFVRIGSAGRSEWAAVNLFDASETDLREPVPVPGLPALPPPAPWHARIPYALPAAALVLALLLAEWWLFHRGWI